MHIDSTGLSHDCFQFKQTKTIICDVCKGSKTTIESMERLYGQESSVVATHITHSERNICTTCQTETDSHVDIRLSPLVHTTAISFSIPRGEWVRDGRRPHGVHIPHMLAGTGWEDYLIAGIGHFKGYHWTFRIFEPYEIPATNSRHGIHAGWHDLNDGHLSSVCDNQAVVENTTAGFVMYFRRSQDVINRIKQRLTGLQVPHVTELPYQVPSLPPVAHAKKRKGTTGTNEKEGTKPVASDKKGNKKANSSQLPVEEISGQKGNKKANSSQLQLQCSDPNISIEHLTMLIQKATDNKKRIKHDFLTLTPNEAVMRQKAAKRTYTAFQNEMKTLREKLQRLRDSIDGSASAAAVDDFVSDSSGLESMYELSDKSSSSEDDDDDDYADNENEGHTKKMKAPTVKPKPSGRTSKTDQVDADADDAADGDEDEKVPEQEIEELMLKARSEELTVESGATMEAVKITIAQLSGNKSFDFMESARNTGYPGADAQTALEEASKCVAKALVNNTAQKAECFVAMIMIMVQTMPEEALTTISKKMRNVWWTGDRKSKPHPLYVELGEAFHLAIHGSKDEYNIASFTYKTFEELLTKRYELVRTGDTEASAVKSGCRTRIDAINHRMRSPMLAGITRIVRKYKDDFEDDLYSMMHAIKVTQNCGRRECYYYIFYKLPLS